MDRPKAGKEGCKILHTNSHSHYLVITLDVPDRVRDPILTS